MGYFDAEALSVASPLDILPLVPPALTGNPVFSPVGRQLVRGSKGLATSVSRPSTSQRQIRQRRRSALQSTYSAQNASQPWSAPQSETSSDGTVHSIATRVPKAQAGEGSGGVPLEFARRAQRYAR